MLGSALRKEPRKMEEDDKTEFFKVTLECAQCVSPHCGPYSNIRMETAPLCSRAHGPFPLEKAILTLFLHIHCIFMWHHT